MEQPEDYKKRKHEELEGSTPTLPRNSLDDDKRVKVATDQICKREVLPEPERTVQLFANYYPVKLIPNLLFMHHMHFEPRTEGEASVPRHIKHSVLKSIKDEIGPYLYWGELLFVKKDLSDQTFRVPVNGVTYTLSLSPTIPIELHSGSRSTKELGQIVSILIKTALKKQKFKQIRRAVYRVDDQRGIPDYAMYAVPGYITNVDFFHGGLMLNVDVSFRFFQHRTVLQMMPKDEEQCKRMMKGSIVSTIYLDKKASPNFYHITGVDYTLNPRSTFLWRKRTGNKYEQAQEQPISYVEYYKMQYGIEITVMDQPLLVSSNKRRRPTDGVVEEHIIYLVPELCRLAGLTEEMRTDGQLRRAIKAETSDTALQRMNSLRAFVNRLNPGQVQALKEKPDPGTVLAEWGLEISSSPFTTTGRLLPQPTIKIGNRKEKETGGDATWMNLFGEPPTRGRSAPQEINGLFAPIHLDNWALVYWQRDANCAENLLTAFHKVSSELCLKIREPFKLELRSQNDFKAEMRKAYQAHRFAIMVAILPSQNVSIYRAAKDIMLHEPVSVQAVKNRTLSGGKNIESKCKAILQQIVCKLGGAPWAVRLPFQIPTMIVGIDVSHSKTTRQDSVLALVATINKFYTEYFSDIKTQPQNSEMGTSLGASFKKALQAFRDNNGTAPRNIIIYRDDPGGRGSLEALMENEVECLKAVLERDGIQANLCFIVVRKRGLTRLFRMAGNRYENPVPGTVADSGVVSPVYNEFYLVAHHTRSGTVNPTQYQIVYRTPNAPDLATLSIQQVTYQLCHLYYNYMGTIAEPAPLRYADRLASLMRETLGASKGPQPALEKKLYYL